MINPGQNRGRVAPHSQDSPTLLTALPGVGRVLFFEDVEGNLRHLVEHPIDFRM